MLDWDQVRFFLAIARGGTLSAAARALTVAQPTVGRRLDAFERQLGARLFERRPDGHVLTGAGRHLLAHAEQMEREAIAAERAVSGRDAGMVGAVRVTASEWMIVSVLGPLVGALLARHPGLVIDLIADPHHADLARREADLALRPTEFDRGSVVQRRVARIGFALYAADAYLARRGAPDFARQCADHDLIVMTDEIGDVARAWLDRTCAAARVAVRTNGREAMRAMVAAGVGMACLPRVVGDALPGVRAIAAPAPPERELWLGVHRDVRTVPRVRAVHGFLVDELRRLGPSLGPAPSRRKVHP